MYMDNYIGKHLLVDCYGCRPSSIDSSPDLLAAMIDAAEKIGMTLKENFCHESEDEVIIAAYGDKSHICVHAYPQLCYAAVDIYSFDADLKPTRTMVMLRNYFHPEKIRATSVKRGNINPDMKPNIHSKSTTMHKFKNTGHQMSAAGKKVASYIVHRTEKRDGLGPE